MVDIVGYVLRRAADISLFESLFGCFLTGLVLLACCLRCIFVMGRM